MRSLWLYGLAGLLGLTLTLGTPSFAQDKKTGDDQKKTTTTTAQKPVAPETKAEAKPRLPRGWGQLGLSPDQHEKIIGVMEKYASQIKDLQAQIADLEKKQTDEMTSVLTDKQKSRLAEVTAPRHLMRRPRLGIGLGRGLQAAPEKKEKEKD